MTPSPTNPARADVAAVVAFTRRFAEKSRKHGLCDRAGKADQAADLLEAMVKERDTQCALKQNAIGFLEIERARATAAESKLAACIQVLREDIISANIINAVNEQGGHFHEIRRDCKFIVERCQAAIARREDSK